MEARQPNLDDRRWMVPEQLGQQVCTIAFGISQRLAYVPAELQARLGEKLLQRRQTLPGPLSYCNKL